MADHKKSCGTFQVCVFFVCPGCRTIRKDPGSMAVPLAMGRSIAKLGNK